jgi:putative oxidoreductase
MSTSSIGTRENALQAWGTTLLRVAVGLIFAAHGAQKLFVMGPDGLAGFFGSLGIPFAALNAYFVIGVELIGGIAMVAGLGTRAVATLFAAIMLAAIATVHGAQGFFLPNGYEFTLALLAASLTLTLQGAGAFALDDLFAGRKLTTRQTVHARA